MYEQESTDICNYEQRGMIMRYPQHALFSIFCKDVTSVGRHYV